jgi:hypothetical protein
MREPEGPAYLWIIIVAYLWLNTAVAVGAWDGLNIGVNSETVEVHGVPEAAIHKE